jgi:transcriptional regulator with XRE-family HTH domain
MGDEEMGKWIAQARLRLGWTQTDLSQRLAEQGVLWQQQTIWKVENGVRRVLFTEGVVLAKVLGITPDDLAQGGESALLSARKAQLEEERKQLLLRAAEIKQEIAQLSKRSCEQMPA